MNFEQCIEAIKSELDSAIKLFPEYPTDPLHAIGILGEEFGELNQAVLQTTYEHQKANKEDVKKEAIQTATMAVRFLLSIEKFEYIPSHQHKQDL